jgi:hypothetical protein
MGAPPAGTAGSADSPARAGSAGSAGSGGTAGSGGARRGLLAGLGAFLAFILAPALPLVFSPLFTLLGVLSLGLLSGDARRRGPATGRHALAGLVALAVGMLLLFATNGIAAASLAQGDLGRWRGTLLLYLVAEVLVATGFFLGAWHLASQRSRTLLGVAVGAAVATSLLAAAQAQAPAQALEEELRASGAEPGSAAYGEVLRAAVGRFYETTAGANQAKAVPFILFAWAYATILGRLKHEQRPRDAWALPP